MPKTIVDLTLPFSLLDEGDYPMLFNDKIVKITIRIQHVPSRMTQIMGAEFIAPGATVRMENDFHGMVNISKVRIEFPYYILPTKQESNGDGSYRDVYGDHHVNIQKESIVCLNRLIDVIRLHTHRFWISNLSGSDVNLNQFDLFDDNGDNVGGQLHLQPIYTLFQLPNESKTQEQVKQEINKMLSTGDKIPVHDALYLDALDDFSKGRFNKAVMTINTALESLTTEYLLQELLKKLSKEDAQKKIDDFLSFGNKKNRKSGFHKILTEDFKEVTGRSLEDNVDLWAGFNDARVKRKTTLHPYVGKLSEEKTRKTIIDVLKVMNWVINENKYPIS